VSDRIVLAVSGDDALVLTFAQQLVAAARSDGALAVVTSLPVHTTAPSSFRAAGAGSVLAINDDKFVGGSPRESLQKWLQELPGDAWVIAAGSDACRLIAATFSVGLGRRHEIAAGATDLWLGHASEPVAAALIRAGRAT
jgi:hypothetical protein